MPQTIQDAYIKHYGTPASAEVLAHCKRELMHAIWYLLLDDDFRKAWVNGLPVRFPDSEVIRRAFPRIPIYGCDYPEKYVSISSSFSI